MSESAHDVLDLGWTGALRQHADDVEAQLAPLAGVGGEPPGSRGSQPSYLGVVNRLDRDAEPSTAAGLHLAEHDVLAVAQDQVDLAVRAAPVAVQHHQALSGQVPLGEAFTHSPTACLTFVMALTVAQMADSRGPAVDRAQLWITGG